MTQAHGVILVHCWDVSAGLSGRRLYQKVPNAYYPLHRLFPAHPDVSGGGWRQAGDHS